MSEPLVSRPLPRPGEKVLFFIAGAGLVPGLGIPCSLFAILYGGIARPGFKRAVILAAIPGLAVNLALAGVGYSTWTWYQGLVAPVPLDEREGRRAQERVHIIARTLEYAKSVHGEYPHTLQQLEEWFPSVYFADLWDPSIRPGCRRSYPGYSRGRDGQSYELFGIGPD